MAEEQTTIDFARSPSFDEQLWPIQACIVVLAGCLVGIDLALADFGDQRLFFNGFTYLVLIALIAGLLMFASTRLKSASARSTQLCILLSLMIHAGLACTVINFPLPLGPSDEGPSLSADAEDAQQENIAPDYHWTQAEDPDAQQDFQKPLETKAPESPPNEAVALPRPVEQAATVAAPKPPTAMQITELGTSGAAGAGGPVEPQRLDMRPFEVHRGEDRTKASAEEPEVALLHQLGKGIEAPKADAQFPDVPQAPAKDADKQPDVPESAQLPAVVGPRPNKAHPISVARSGSETGLPLPGANVVALSPTRPIPGGSERRDPVETTATVDRQASLGRSDRASLNVPSMVIPEESFAPKAPAAVGGSPGSRLTKTSDVAVERTENSRAPLGPSTAAAGSQDFGTGAGIVAARVGSAEGHGQRSPGSSNWGTGDPAELRFGADNSFLANGAPLPSAAARKAQASQPENGGQGMGPSQSATLKRSQSPDGIQLPAAALPLVGATVTGAGGTAANPGSETSRLELGPIASEGRTSAADVPRQAGIANGNRLGPGNTADDALPASGSAPRASSIVAMAGLAQSNGRAVHGGLRGDTTPEDSLRRTDSSNIIPDAKADDNGTGMQPSSGTASSSERIAGNAMPGPVTGIGPSAMGTDRIDGPGQALGLPSPRHNLQAPLDDTIVAAVPRPSGPASRQAGPGEGDFGQATTGVGPGRSRLGRNGTGLALDGAVKEPTEFYRRRAAMKHGTGPADGDGSGFTEPAVEQGLEFFSRMQFPDGHWSLDKVPDGMPLDAPSRRKLALGSYESNTAATGMSLLGYLGAGYTHLDEKHRDTVRRGLDWLIRHQKPDGNLFADSQGDAQKYAQFYSHGIAAMALCEAYGMTQDPDLREPAQKAVDFIVHSQDPTRGGWRYLNPTDGRWQYDPLECSDTSVTGWQLMALKSAQMAGLDVPDATFRRIGEWLDRAKGPEPGTYVYNPWNPVAGGRAPSAVMTAEAMLMRMYMGRHRDDAEIVQGADYVLAHLPEADVTDDAQRNVYYWYYATQSMYQMGGKYWKTWNKHIGPLVRAGQVKEGPLAGSWHPTEPVADRWGAVGGRMYVTSMRLLMLEVYYRHLPLFQELSK
jgi:hypothetical protein